MNSNLPDRIFRILLRALPRKHREEFRADMLGMFRQGLREECRTWRDAARYTARTGADVLASAAILRAESLAARLGCGERTPGERFRRGLTGGNPMQSWIYDLRHGARGLLRSPSLAAVAVITLGLGIGANTAIFSVLNTALLRPLPFEKPDQLVHIYETNPLKGWTRQVAAPANFLDWKRLNTSFQDMAGYWSFGGVTLKGEQRAHRVRLGRATGSLFGLLGVKPLHGRLFREEETWKGGPRVAVISHSYWRSRFAGRPEAVGKRLSTTWGQEAEIVGVLPPGVRLPGLGEPPQVWLPSHWDPEVHGKKVFTRRAHWVSVVGRLKPDASVAQAEDELQAIAARLEDLHPDTNEQMGVGVIALREWVSGEARTPLLLLMATVLTVLVIACLNVANLLLARGAARRREVSIRNALGASRWRILRQLLLESLLLSLAAGGVGLLLAYGGVAFLKSAAPAGIPRLWELGVDGWVLAFALGCSIATVFLFGLLPAWTLSRSDPSQGLQQGGRQGWPGARSPVRRPLVAAEVALSVVLVVAAGLLLRSFLELNRVEAGFDPENVLSLRLDLDDSGYEEPAQALALIERVQERAAALPGVASAGLATSLPIGGDGTWSGDASFEGQREYVSEFRHREVDEGYFRTMGVPILQGRPFERSDNRDSELVAIINQSFARHLKEGSPVGRRIKLTPPDREAPWMTVVGVVANERYQSLRDEGTPMVYQPLRQRVRAGLHLLLKASRDPSELADPARAMVTDIEPDLAVFEVRPVASYLREALAGERFLAQLVAVFAALALVLAAVGLYGVLAYGVSRRRREFGIRMALGAGMGDILGLVMRQGLSMTLAGLAAGLLGAWAASRFISGLLFGVTPTDPATFASVALCLLAVALAACYHPARRAARLDPQDTLRAE